MVGYFWIPTTFLDRDGQLHCRTMEEKNMGYRLVPDCNHAQESQNMSIFSFFRISATLSVAPTHFPNKIFTRHKVMRISTPMTSKVIRWTWFDTFDWSVCIHLYVVCQTASFCFWRTAFFCPPHVSSTSHINSE